MKPLFKIRFADGDVHPGTIPASDLAQLIIAAERTVLALVRRAHPDIPEEELILGLSQVEDASVGLVYASRQEEPVSAAYQELTAALTNRLFSALPAESLDGLRTLTTFSNQHKCRTEFWNGGTAPIIELLPDFILEIPKPVYVRGATVLFGKLERVGGLTPRARLRTPDGRKVYCDVNESLARELGTRLYEQVGISGHATWDPRDESIVYFRGEALTDFGGGSIRESFADLHKASQGFFDSITDVDQFARELRHGDEK